MHMAYKQQSLMIIPLGLSSLRNTFIRDFCANVLVLVVILLSTAGVMFSLGSTLHSHFTGRGREWVVCVCGGGSRERH